MKINQLTTLFAILATMLFAVACGEQSTETTTEEPTAAAEPAAEEVTEEAAEEPAEEAAEEQAAEPAAAAEGGSVCERAQRCCEAYVDAMNARAPGSVSADTACAGIAAVRNTPGAAADSTCQTTIDGFRTGLSAAQLDVPADCAAQ